MSNHASYVLFAYSSFKYLTVDDLIKVGVHQDSDPNPIPSFDENLLINLCKDATEVFSKESTILELDGDTYVVGDIHGSYHDLLRILNRINTDDSKVVFLGDYVDRGSFSLECITLLFSMKIMYPNKFFLLRGNHEFDAMCSVYGFKKEIMNYHNPKKTTDQKKKNNAQAKENRVNDINFDEEEDEEIPHEVLCDNYYANHVNMNCYKYTEDLYNAFLKAFSFLPISAIVNKTTLCIHGGLSPHLDKVEMMNKLIQRPISNIDSNVVLTDLLWGDPVQQSPSFYSDNPRGRGKLFNGACLINFLKKNGLKRIARAHECINNGVDVLFNDKCITVFSASSYNKDLGNSSGILKLSKVNDEYVESFVFDPIKRLKKCDAVYFKVRTFIEKKVSKPVFSQFNLKSFPSMSYLPNSNFINEDLKNVEVCQSIPKAKSIRTNASNLRLSLLNNRITFNTGFQNKKSAEVTSPIKSNIKFDNDNDPAFNSNKNQVRLLSLTAK